MYSCPDYQTEQLWVASYIQCRPGMCRNGFRAVFCGCCRGKPMYLGRFAKALLTVRAAGAGEDTVVANQKTAASHAEEVG